MVETVNKAFRNFQSAVLRAYENEPVEIREKARMYFYFVFPTALFIVVLFVVFNAYFDFRTVNWVLSFYLCAVCVSILFLKAGRYYRAVNLAPLCFACGIIFMGSYGLMVLHNPDFITNYYFYPSIILFAALFCRMRWVAFLTVVLILNGLVSYLYTVWHPLGGAFALLSRGAVLDCITALFFSAILCNAIIRLNARISAISNREKRSREIERELEVARLIQLRLLPGKIGEDPGFAINSVFIPMDKVGGDFYDIVNDGDSIKFFIADVSGHGIPGAFLALITKVTMQNMMRGQIPTCKVLENLNEVLLESTVRGNFVTCFYCCIEKRTRIIRYASAGHLTQLVFRGEDGSIHELEPSGSVLGWIRDIRLAEKSFQLMSGDRVILYTDGVVESMNGKGELFGDERFREVIAEKGRGIPGDFIEGLMERLKEYTGGGQFRDDLTLITLDVR